MPTIKGYQAVADQGRQEELPPIQRQVFEELVARGEVTEKVAPETSLLGDIDQNISGFTAEALNTFTFGLADKIAQAGEEFSQQLFGAGPERGTPKERREQFAQENPKAAITASIIGGFANPVGQRIGGFIAKAPTTASTIGRGATGGATLGSLQAAGESEGDLQERAIETGGGALLGAGLGGAIPGVIAGAKGAGKGIVNLVERFSDKVQGTVALRKVAEALERDGFTPERALQRINDLGPEAALIDIGPNSRALAFTAFGIPGKGKSKILDFLTKRQEGVRDPQTGEIKGGQIARIQQHIDDIVPENFFNQREVLANIDKSSKLYQSAFNQNQQIESKAIDNILKTPAGRKAFQNARVTLQNLQTNLSKGDPELTRLAKESGVVPTGRGVGKGLKLQFLDQVKKEMFDLETLAKTPFGKPTARSDSITKLRRKLVDEIDKVDEQVTGGDYSKARLLAGDKLANQEALEQGANFMSKAKFGSPEELRIALNEMSPEARHLFRVGAAQAMKAKIGDTVSRADATKKLLDIPALENKIKIAFGDEQLFAKYTKFLEGEKDLFRAVTDVLSNSKTAERLAAQGEAGLDPAQLLEGARQVAGGQLITGAVNVAKGALQKITTPAGRPEAIADILTGRSVKGLENIRPTVTPLSSALQPRTLEETLIRALVPQTGGQ